MLKMQLFECENTCESRPHEDSEPTYRAVRYNRCSGFQRKFQPVKRRFAGVEHRFFDGALSHETVFSSRQQVDTRIGTANHAFNKIQGGRVVTSGVALTRRATFSSFRTTKFFYDVAVRSSLGRFFHVNQVSFVKDAFVFLS